MVYPSHLIDDFAFCFKYIEEKEKSYAEHGLGVRHWIIPSADGTTWTVLFRPYEF